MKSIYLTFFFYTLISFGLFNQSLGTGEAGFSDQTAVTLNKPIRFCEYKEGDFLFVDFNNYEFRLGDKNGKVISLFGGPNKKGFHYDKLDLALFDGINGVSYDKKNELDRILKMSHGITWDSKGNLYVADMGGNAIYKIADNTKVTKVEATPENGFDKLNKPADVIIINGTVCVADLHNHQLKQQKL